MSKSVGNLSLTEKVGQMFMIGLKGTTPNETIVELIQKHKIGGVVLYENNVESVEQLLTLINSLKTINMGNEVPLFVAIAQEGGRANLIPKEIRKLPAIKYIAESSDKSLIYDTALVTGKVLNAFGINMNFWPVLDLGGAVGGRVLSDRIISNNPTIVSGYSDQIINGLKDQGIIPVPKYFPGHGTTKNKNSSIVIPYTTKSVQKLEQADLVPFRNAIANGIDTMLVGHINLAKLNLFAPASVSYKVITKLLKEKYGFKGIVISDDLSSTAVDIQYGIKSSVRKAILAGSDMLIIKDESKVTSVLEDIEKQIKVGNLSPQEIDLRVQKILDLKEKYNIVDKEITEIEIKNINDEVEALLERIKR